MSLPTYTANAGDKFSASLRLRYQTQKVKRLPTSANYANLAIFFRPPLAWVPNRKAQGGLVYRQTGSVDVSTITLTPARQKVTDDNQEITVEVTIPSTFGMTEWLKAGEEDKLKLTMAAAYVADGETISGNGPTGRTWDVGEVSVKRRPSIALITGRDNPTTHHMNDPPDSYFTSASKFFRTWMQVEDSGQVRNLADVVTWLRHNPPKTLGPWGMVHIVGHSDGHVWIINPTPFPSVINPGDPCTAPGWNLLSPARIRQVADDLGKSNSLPQAAQVGADTHVVIHCCNFAAQNTLLLAAAQSLFAAKPQVHGPNLYVAFGAPDTGPKFAEHIESLATRLSAGPPATYQTQEIAPDPFTSSHFVHFP